jgi:hypothetical protein
MNLSQAHNTNESTRKSALGKRSTQNNTALQSNIQTMPLACLMPKTASDRAFVNNSSVNQPGLWRGTYFTSNENALTPEICQSVKLSFQNRAQIRNHHQTIINDNPT